MDRSTVLNETAKYYAFERLWCRHVAFLSSALMAEKSNTFLEGEIQEDMKEILPEEIIQIFSDPLGYSVLIRGSAGAGKTTLALTLVEYFEDDYEPIFISTRLSPESLKKQFPKTKTIIKPENIFDASQTFIPPFTHQDLNALIENTLEFKSKKAFIKTVYEHIEKYDNPLIIIDSWEPLGDGINPNSHDRTHFETTLIELSRKLDIKIIFISDDLKATYLQNIVDCVLHLEDKTLERRILRTLTIEKIRNKARYHKCYPYSLLHREFQAFFPLSPYSRAEPQEFLLQEDKTPYYSTGIEDLDKILHGGWPIHSFNLLEVDSEVPLEAFSPFVFATLCNFVKKERGSILYTLDGINSPLINKESLMMQISAKGFQKNIRVLMDTLQRTEIRPYIVPLEKNQFEDIFLKVYEDLSERTNHQPVFSAILYDSLEFLVDFPRAIEKLASHIKIIRNCNIVELAIMSSSITQENNNLFKEFSQLANTHFKLTAWQGRILFYGIKPWTNIYSLHVDYNLGYPQVQLIPII